jgi:hypothetical protein
MWETMWGTVRRRRKACLVGTPADARLSLDRTRQSGEHMVDEMRHWAAPYARESRGRGVVVLGGENVGMERVEQEMEWPASGAAADVGRRAAAAKTPADRQLGAEQGPS